MSTKRMIIAIETIILIAIMVVLSACNSSIKESTPEEIAENYVLAIYTADPEALVECVPPFLLMEMARSYGIYDGDKEDLINIMKANIREEDISDCVIKNIKSENKVSDIDAYKENMDNFGATNEDLAKIEEYSTVRVTSLVDNQDMEDIVFCVKYEGRWYACQMAIA